MQLEDIRGFVRDEEGVSPVIGVILMVAITVILAAVIGTFVLGLGDDVTEATAPTADFDFDTETGEDGVESVTITHAGGDSIPESELGITGDVSDDYETLDEDWISADEDDVTAGDSITLEEDGDGIDEDGGTLQVVWEADGADSSQVLAEYDYSA